QSLRLSYIDRERRGARYREAHRACTTARISSANHPRQEPIMITAELADLRDLGERDIHAILARNTTGRIAFLMDGEIEIRPVSYVYSGEFIYLRSSATASLAGTDPEGTVVGFEVDEIHATNRWRSVVIRGTL